MNDALDAFAVWEGQELGPDDVAAPGFAGTFHAPAVHLHIAGAWCMSSARRDRDGGLHPAVYVKLLAGVVGTGPTYHVLEGIVDADSPIDIAAGTADGAVDLG